MRSINTRKEWENGAEAPQRSPAGRVTRRNPERPRSLLPGRNIENRDHVLQYRQLLTPPSSAVQESHDGPRVHKCSQYISHSRQATPGTPPRAVSDFKCGQADVQHPDECQVRRTAQGSGETATIPKHDCQAELGAHEEHQLDPRLPWDLFHSGVPDHTHWTVTPPVRQLLMEFRAYSSASQSHLVRALCVLETAMDWSRACEHLETRGNYRTAHLVKNVVPPQAINI